MNSEGRDEPCKRCEELLAGREQRPPRGGLFFVGGGSVSQEPGGEPEGSELDDGGEEPPAHDPVHGGGV